MQIGRKQSEEIRAPEAQYGVHLCDSDHDYQSAWKITERILARLKREIQLAGSKFVVFSVPADYEADARSIGRVRKELDDPDKYCIPEAGYRHLQDILERNGIPLIDLLYTFQENAKSERLFGPDRHWNENGHKIAAAEVYKQLIHKKLLP